TVVIGLHSTSWLIRIGTQKIKNGAPQLSWTSLQIVEKIKAKQIWVNIASPSCDDLARIGERQNTGQQQPPNHCIGISRGKLSNPPETHPHGQLRPGSFNRITGQKNHLQFGEITDDSFNHLIIQHRIGWRDVARKARPLVREQARIILHVDVGSGPQTAYPLQKGSIPLVSTPRRIYSLSLRQFIEIMQFLQRR